METKKAKNIERKATHHGLAIVPVQPSQARIIIVEP